MTPEQASQLNYLYTMVEKGLRTQGNQSAGGVPIAWLPREVAGIRADLARVLAAAGGDVDEAEVAREILAVLTPQAIAGAIPTDLAAEVVDLLVARLAQ